MRLVAILGLIISLVSCSHTSKSTGEVSSISKDPLKTLVYESHELPNSYKNLIGTSGNIDSIFSAYENSKDEYVRYSYTVVVFEKSTQNLNEEDRVAAEKFFSKALKDDFDWVKQTAVWGLSRVGTLNNFSSLIKVMEEDEAWLEDDVHEALAMIRSRSQNKRKPASEEQGINYHNSSYWKNWWARNSK